MYAQQRLQKKNIFCIAPRSINVSGSIDCVCFDKTGTLTEDGLDMYGVVPKTVTNSLQIPLKQIERLQFDHLLYGMVTCHSITIMNGEMKGDPLDLKMFESTGWKLEEANVADDKKYDLLFPTVVKPPVKDPQGSNLQLLLENASEPQLDALDISSHDIGIVREFSFTSSLQRMAVITRKISDKNFNVYCKGSPEMIATLCRPETIPTDFNEKLNYYAQQGYRIIALAYKSLDRKMTYPKIQRVSREKIESELEFLGFVILENRLKPDSEKVIKILNDANIRTIMVTGDNILTAISVAKDCDMIAEDQSIIIVNSRWINDEEAELFYTLEGHSTSATANNNNMMVPTPASMEFVSDGAGDGKYKLMTNSNSVSSLETVETNTHSTVNRDAEKGERYFNNVKKKKTFFDADEDLNPYRLAPELPCNRYRFAMDGKTWAIVREYYPDLLPKFVTRGTIFARMSPDQKQQLITELQDIGYYVAMCGDGANDCGALKVAHTGISLSDAESSVASPFTSRDRTIDCVPAIIQEGRAALVTSFGIFKYMAAYSLVQFTSVIILYTIDSNLTDMQFLYIDLFMISVFAFFFGKTESYDGPLVRQTPLNSLIALSPVASLALHLITSIIILGSGWFHVQQFEWFEPFIYKDPENGGYGKENLGCHQNYAIFIISCFQYMTLAIVFSKGAPYRKSIFSNYGLMISLCINLAVTLYFALYPIGVVAGFMEIVAPPSYAMLAFGGILIIYGVVNFVVGMFIEQVIVEYILFKKLRYRFHNIEKSHKKFLSIENYLRMNSKWPPLSLYNNQENNTPSDDESKGNPNSGGSKNQTNSKDDDDDDISPMSYAEISIEPVEEDGAVVFDRNSSILNSFFERERQRLASINQSRGDSTDDNESVFNIGESIRKKNEQLKREYLELKITDPAKPLLNGFVEDHKVAEIFKKRKEGAADDNAVEMQNLPKI